MASARTSFAPTIEIDEKNSPFVLIGDNRRASSIEVHEHDGSARVRAVGDDERIDVVTWRRVARDE